MLMSVFISLLLPAAGANLATALTSHLRCCVIWSAAVLCAGVWCYVVWCFRVLCGVLGYCGGVLLSLWSKVVEFCGVLWWSVVGL